MTIRGHFSDFEARQANAVHCAFGLRVDLRLLSVPRLVSLCAKCSQVLASGHLGKHNPSGRRAGTDKVKLLPARYGKIFWRTGR